MRDIRILRIDERLIHGQVVTAWLQSTRCDTIVVADNKAATDTLMQTLFKMAIPKNINLKVLGIKDAVKYINGDGTEKVMLIVGSLESVSMLMEEGLEIKEINVGNINQHPSKKKYFKSIWLDENDIGHIDKLKKKGVDINVQVVPSERKFNIVELLK